MTVSCCWLPVLSVVKGVDVAEADGLEPLLAALQAAGTKVCTKCDVVPQHELCQISAHTLVATSHAEAVQCDLIGPSVSITGVAGHGLRH
jgi:hypothetical protein